MDNSEAQATLDTSHRTKTKQQHNTQWLNVTNQIQNSPWGKHKNIMFVHFKNYLQCTPTPPKKKLNKYNSEAQATLDTSHRTKTKQQHNTEN
jgi:hypothetical protein